MNVAALKRQLILHEGIELKPYTDTVGKLSIGVGRNLADRGISTVEAAFLLENDIAVHTEELDEHLPWWKALDEVRQRALLDLCFNMGIGNESKGLRSFRRMLQALEAGRYTDVAKELLDSTWARQVQASRVKRITYMMETGKDREE